MANPFLFQSSVYLGLLHILAVLKWNADPWLTTIYTIGTMSSLWNHGETNPAAKWFDRAWMTLGMATDLIYITNLPKPAQTIGYTFVLAYVLLYTSAKYLHNTFPHLLAQVVATGCHLWLIHYYHVHHVSPPFRARLDPGHLQETPTIP